MDWFSFTEFAKEHGVTGVAILLFLVSIVYLLRQLLDENRASLFRARIYKALFYFSKRREHEKKYIANDVRGRLNLARDHLHCGHMILPKAVNVEWIEGTKPESYEISDGEFVVCLDPASQQEQNIVHLGEIIVQQTSLIGIRHLIDKPLQRAIDITLTKRILYETQSAPALHWFYENILRPVLDEAGTIADWSNKVIEIDEQGLFNILLLVELEDFSNRIAGMTPRPYMIGEIEHLVKFVHRVATKEIGVNVPLEYLKAHMKVGITLVARAETILKQGIEPYVTTSFIKIKNVDTLYLIIWEKKYLVSVSDRPDDYIKYKRRCNKLVKEIENLPGVQRDFEVLKYEYTDPRGRRREGRLVRYLVNRGKT